VIEFQKADLPVVQQSPINVFYEKEIVNFSALPCSCFFIFGTRMNTPVKSTSLLTSVN
jgi:hypothetical protein